MSRAWGEAALASLRSNLSARSPLASRLWLTRHSSAERSLPGDALAARADAPEQLDAAAVSADAAESERASRHAESAVAAECDPRFAWTLRSIGTSQVTPDCSAARPSAPARAPLHHERLRLFSGASGDLELCLRRTLARDLHGSQRRAVEGPPRQAEHDDVMERLALPVPVAQ